MQKHEDFDHQYDTHGNLRGDQSYIPERSRLYSLKPILMNGSTREGLSSYICRLAESHSVSPGVLIKQEILPSFRKKYTIGPKVIHRVESVSEDMTVTQIPKPAYKKNVNERGLLSFQYVEGIQSLVLAFRNIISIM